MLAMTQAGMQQPNYLGQGINQHAYQKNPIGQLLGGGINGQHTQGISGGGGGGGGWATGTVTYASTAEYDPQEPFGEGRTTAEDAAWYEAVTQDFPK